MTNVTFANGPAGVRRRQPAAKDKPPNSNGFVILLIARVRSSTYPEKEKKGVSQKYCHIFFCAQDKRQADLVLIAAPLGHVC